MFTALKWFATNPLHRLIDTATPVRVSGALTDRGFWLAAFVGALLPLGFAPFSLYWLVPVLLAVLFATWMRCPARVAARRGFGFGFGAFLTGTYWLYISIHVFGQAPRWLAVFLMLGMVLAMALYLAGCGWLAARCRSRWLALDALLLWPACWVFVEWLRGWLFTGFPWLSLGYAQINGPLAAWAPVTGVYGLSAAVTFVAGALLCLWRGSLPARLAALAGLLALALGTVWIDGSHWTRPNGPELRVALVQGGISQDLKWLPEQRVPTMELYRRLSLDQPDADIVVWPEVAIPAMAHQVETYLDGLRQHAAERGQWLLLGILSYDFDRDQYYNALLQLGPQTGVYYKRHLVPFGEFFPVPDFVRSWMRLMSLPYRDAARGARYQPLLKAAGVGLAPSICYEDAYGTELLDFLPAAGLLVNVSNDAWFGDSLAPHQHLQIARMRALETGRDMLRATNTGITALIGADGRIRKQSPQFRTDVLTGRVQPRSGATPFVRFGNWPVIIVATVLLGLGIWLGRRR